MPDQRSSARRAKTRLATACLAVAAAILPGMAQQPPGSSAPAPPVDFIDTSIENASPLWYDVADGVVRIHLIYDHERASPNRAAGHVHFLLNARPGTKLTLEFLNLDNVWNGQPGSVAGELKTMAISDDGRAWKTVPTESLPGNRVQLHCRNARPGVVRRAHGTVPAVGSRPPARIDPESSAGTDHDDRQDRGGSRTRDREDRQSRGALPGLRPRPGASVGSRQQLGRRGADPAAAERRRGGEAIPALYSVTVLPMANKDGVARGRTRFNLRGRDLNRNWDKPADPEVAPENAVLERWLEGEIAAGRRPHLALELHNDGNGRLHISRPPVPQLERHLARMAIFEELLRSKTWFTEGSTNAAFRNSGTLGDGWLERYGIDAAVHEFNCNWIAGLKDTRRAGIGGTTGPAWRKFSRATSNG